MQLIKREYSHEYGGEGGKIIKLINRERGLLENKLELICYTIVKIGHVNFCSYHRTKTLFDILFLMIYTTNYYIYNINITVNIT